MKIFIFSAFMIASYAFLSLNTFLYSDTFEGKIAFIRDYKNGPHIFVLDGKDGKLKKLVREGRNYAPKWAPNGSKIAFLSIRSGHSQEIYILEVPGNREKRLTHTNGMVLTYRWDSKGNEIFVTSKENGIIRNYIIDVGTGKRREISKELNGIKEERPIIIPSPDERHQIWYYEYPHRKMSLINMLTHGKKGINFGGTPKWSKDSKKIAYFKDPSPRETMVLIDLEKNETTEIRVFKGDLDYAECGGISWSRDSEKIVYECGPVAGPHAGEPWLYIFDLKTNKFTKLIQGSNPDWY